MNTRIYLVFLVPLPQISAAWMGWKTLKQKLFLGLCSPDVEEKKGIGYICCVGPT